MRKQYEAILKKHLHTTVFRTRCDLNISQEEMAERLFMSTRSYIDLDHGKTGCSGITLALFLIYVCPEPITFLEELRNAFEKSNDQAA